VSQGPTDEGGGFHEGEGGSHGVSIPTGMSASWGAGDGSSSQHIPLVEVGKDVRSVSYVHALEGLPHASMSKFLTCKVGCSKGVDKLLVDKTSLAQAFCVVGYHTA
jgi:hypothetical protein